ncbi:MAG: hypothetical protein GFGODING_03218 [Flavobacteriales bacterium]|nr:hypothetical protein [Flavobacteriales bacterium]
MPSGPPERISKPSLGTPYVSTPMRSTIALVSASYFVALLLAGCSGDGDGASGMSGSVEEASGGELGSNEEFATVEINGQVWMAENLNTDKFRNGDAIPEIKSNDEWKKACEEGKPAWCYYDNALRKGEELGKLYNWHAVNDPRGLAPNGWHIPTKEEWDKLTGYYGSDAGLYLKSMDFGRGNNESGFNALAGGRRENDGFKGLGQYKYGYWWTSTNEDRSKLVTKDYYICQNRVGSHFCNEGVLLSHYEIQSGQANLMTASDSLKRKCPECGGDGFDDDGFQRALLRARFNPLAIEMGGEMRIEYGGDYDMRVKEQDGDVYSAYSVRCVRDK